MNQARSVGWKYENNLDWNHALGAVPANILPRYLMGILIKVSESVLWVLHPL